MRCFLYLCLISSLLLSSCAQQKGNRVESLDKQITTNRERITLSDVSIGTLNQRMERIEKMMLNLVTQMHDVTQNIKGLRHLVKEQPKTPAPKKLPSLPVLSGKNPKWTKREREMSTHIIKDLETSTEKFPNQSLNNWVGKKFPFARLIAGNGELIELEQFQGKKKVLLVILRGFAGSVCLVCSSQTIALTNTIDKFKDKNTEVLAVYPGKADTVPGFLEAIKDLKENFEPAFSVALDADFTLANELGIVAHLAKPTSMIIDEKGIIRYIYVGKHPGDRPSSKVLLAEIDKL